MRQVDKEALRKQWVSTPQRVDKGASPRASQIATLLLWSPCHYSTEVMANGAISKENELAGAVLGGHWHGVLCWPRGSRRRCFLESFWADITQTVDIWPPSLRSSVFSGQRTRCQRVQRTHRWWRQELAQAEIKTGILIMLVGPVKKNI